MKDIITRTVTVSPQWATDRLNELAALIKEGQFRQRYPKEGKVRQYAQDMKSGQWRLTHQGLAFSGTGENGDYGALLDGQNRLWAVVRSNATLPMKASFNCPPEVMDNIDTGSVRDLGQILHISHGFEGSVTELAVFSRQLINMVFNAMSPKLKPGRGHRVQVSTAQALYVLQELQFAVSLDRFRVLVPKRLARRGPLEAAWALYHAVRPKLAEKFATEYATLEELPKGSPSLALYRYYEQNRTGVMAADQHMVCANAIQAHDKGEKITLLQPSREALRWLVRLNPGTAEKIMKRVAS